MKFCSSYPPYSSKHDHLPETWPPTNQNGEDKQFNENIVEKINVKEITIEWMFDLRAGTNRFLLLFHGIVSV